MENYYRSKTKSLLYYYYMFVDIPEHKADHLFIDHKVSVWFDGDFSKPGEHYRIVVCHIRKRDENMFLEALSELPRIMMLLGYRDYEEYCEEFVALGKSSHKIDRRIYRKRMAILKSGRSLVRFALMCRIPIWKMFLFVTGVFLIDRKKCYILYVVFILNNQ